MKRVERRKQARRTRRRTFWGAVLCLLLFFCGLMIVDASSREMLGNEESKPIFGIYNAGRDIIQLDMIGETVYIDKRDIRSFVQAMKTKLKELKKQVMSQY